MKALFHSLRVLLPIVLLVAAAPRARAEDASIEALQKAQLERLRAQMANELHLQAFDLLDELVYGWMTHPPFATDTPVVIADVTVPLGFGSGLEALIENHLAGLLLKNAQTHVVLAQCTACTALAVHSDAAGTVISKGVDQPGTLAVAGQQSGAQHALFVDFEAEGSALVLRARITALTPTLPIVFARTLSTSTSSPALLRAGDHLVSAEQARQDYLDAIQQRGPVVIPVRLAITQYASGSDGTSIAVPPLLWLQTGAEMAINASRDWTGSLVLGGTYIPLLYSGALVQARVGRLLTGPAASLTMPNLYGYVGATVFALQGPTALLLRDGTPTITDVLQSVVTDVTPIVVIPAFRLGLDLRIGNRMGAGFFVETNPTLGAATSVGRYLDFGVVQIQSLGGEVSVCF